MRTARSEQRTVSQNKLSYVICERRKANGLLIEDFCHGSIKAKSERQTANGSDNCRLLLFICMLLIRVVFSEQVKMARSEWREASGEKREARSEKLTANSRFIGYFIYWIKYFDTVY